MKQGDLILGKMPGNDEIKQFYIAQVKRKYIQCVSPIGQTRYGLCTFLKTDTAEIKKVVKWKDRVSL